ncbi:MAG TPA: carbamoyltransferase C-terminal domain-containing protein [Gemmatimonadota bacterium]|jgi:carbamoyltransferase
MNVLGLNAYHADAAAALVVDGRLVAAAEEERFRRVKHWAGFPSEAVAWCLREGRLDLGDVDVVAVNRDPRANLWRKVAYTLRHRPQAALVRDRLRNARRIGALEELLSRAAPGKRGFAGRIRRVEHHLAHQASAFLVSPFLDAVLLSVDGFGDFSSASWGVGSGGRMRLDGRVYFPHSLGIFYLAMTQYLGFPKYGDEYKVMGLAPYGRPSRQDAMRQVVRTLPGGEFRLDLDFFRHHREDLAYGWEAGAPTVERHYTDALVDLLGPARREDEDLGPRHFDIARSAQARFEEAVLEMLRAIHPRYGLDSVVVSGGAAMNSVANGKVTSETPFARVFAPPAPGDAGGAVGAALVAFQDRGWLRPEPMRHSYYGPGYDPDAVRAALDNEAARLEAAGCEVGEAIDEESLCRAVADRIADGEVLGWFQGRMELGPRALGNRSILCDPRRPDMRELINAKIKLREPFRPFAPSILREAMAEWFEVDDDVPFMMKVYAIREEKRSRIPAVTHVDGSGRPHTVTADANPLYHRLIRCFAARTGVPMVLNTSFNENEPIVNRPEEALDCFLRTEMDSLVLGPFVVTKPRPA